MKLRSRFVMWCLGVGLAPFAAPLGLLNAADKAETPAGRESVVTMRPFKVMAEWVEIQPVLKNKVIDHVRIVHVQPASPAAAAGVQMGMQVIEIQGVSMVGLKEADFIQRLESLPPASALTLKVRSVSGKEPTVLAVPFTAAASASNIAAPTVPAPVEAPAMSVKEVTTQLAAARRAIEDDLARVRAEAREMGKASTNMYLQTQIAKDLGRALPTHLELLCETAAKTGDASDGMIFRTAILTAVTAKRDYMAEHKAVVLRYLPKLPELLDVIERLGWYEGADAPLRAAWKKLSDGVIDDVPSFRTSKYAVLAARHGVTDALVALARAVQARGRSEPNRRKVAPSMIAKVNADEEAALKTLMPQETGDAASVAKAVLKNKNRLEFDDAKGVYRFRP